MIQILVAPDGSILIALHNFGDVFDSGMNAQASCALHSVFRLKPGAENKTEFEASAEDQIRSGLGYQFHSD